MKKLCSLYAIPIKAPIDLEKGDLYKGVKTTDNMYKEFFDEKTIDYITTKHKPLVFDKFKITDNKEETIKAIQAQMFLFKLKGNDLDISVDKENNILFFGSDSLAQAYIEEKLSLSQCKDINKYFNKQENISCYDKEVLFKKNEDKNFELSDYLNKIMEKNNIDITIFCMDIPFINVLYKIRNGEKVDWDNLSNYFFGKE
jgi:hypothetical protein